MKHMSFWDMFEVELQWSECCCRGFGPMYSMYVCMYVMWLCLSHFTRALPTWPHCPCQRKFILLYPSVTCNMQNECHSILPAKHQLADTKDKSKMREKNQRRRTNTKAVLPPLMQHLFNSCKILYIEQMCGHATCSYNINNWQLWPWILLVCSHW